MKIRFAQVISCYNQRDLLPRALESVLSQSLLPDEIIIGDDASSDGSGELISAYAQKHTGLIRPVLSNVNGGIARNLNRCIEKSNADLISILAADDWILPDKFETEFDIIQHFWPRYGVYYSDSYVEYAATGKRESWHNRRPEEAVLSELIRRRFHIRNYWYSRKLWEEIGGYDEELKMYEDWKMKMELALRTPFKYCPGVFSVYNVTEGGISAQSADEHLQAVRMITADILSRNEIGSSERRRFEAVVAHYEMMAGRGLYFRAKFGFLSIAKDRAWLVPLLKILWRSISRRLGVFEKGRE